MIILVGFKASGKSLVGKLVAQYLKKPFYDTDRLIEAQMDHQMSCSQIYQTYKEPFFRSLEKGVIHWLKDPRGVVSTGGGCVDDPENIEFLKKQGDVFYLQCPWSLLKERFAPSMALDEGRLDLLQQRLLKREPLYQKMANCICDGGAPPMIVAKEIVTWMEKKKDGIK